MNQLDLYIYPAESDVIVPASSATRIITYTPSNNFIVQPDSPQTNIVVSPSGMRGPASTIPGPPGSTTVEIATSIMGKIFPDETLFRITLTTPIELTPSTCYCDATGVLTQNIELTLTLNSTIIGTILFPANSIDPVTATTHGIFQFVTLSNIGPGTLQLKTPIDVGDLGDLSITITGER